MATTVTSTGDSGTGTLRAALLAGATAIRFDSSVFPASAPATITLSSELAVSSTVEIDGTGAGVAISGNGAVRIFNVSGTLTLKNVRLANGKATTHGSAISAASGATLNLENVAISGCSTTKNGAIYVASGAVANVAGTLTVSGNSAKNGGALCIYGVLNFGRDGAGNDVRVVATFSNNTATTYGGVYMGFGTVRVYGTSDSTLTFSSNTAGRMGGAFYSATNGAAGNLDFSGPGTVLFSGNSAEQRAGAIANYAILTVRPSGSGVVRFSGNEAGYGGAVDLGSDSVATFGGTGRVEFIGNRAVVRDTAISENDYGGFGGGLSEATSASDATTFESAGTYLFSGNEAGISGGGLYARNGTATLNGNFTFVSNTAGDSGAGALFAGTATVGGTLCFGSTSDSTLGNVAGNYGGGLWSLRELTFGASASATFAYNSAKYGGAIANTARTSTQAELVGSLTSESGSAFTFQGNAATLYGNAIYNDATASFGTTTFVNDAISSLGTLYCANGSETTFDAGTAFATLAAESGVKIEFTGDHLILDSTEVARAEVDFDGTDPFLSFTQAPTLTSGEIDGCGYLAVPPGSDMSQIDISGEVTTCDYGARITFATISRDESTAVSTVSWTKQNSTSNVCVESYVGGEWSAANAYHSGTSQAFQTTTTEFKGRIFDGEKFWNVGFLRSITLSTESPRVGTAVAAVVYSGTTVLTESIGYQWSRVDANGTATAISGATSASYTPVLDDVGSVLRVAATGSGAYTGTVVEDSDSGTSVKASRVGVSTSSPKVGTKISAKFYYGSTVLTAATAIYQWSRVDANGTPSAISGATSASYTPVVEDVGKKIRVSAAGTGYYLGTFVEDSDSETIVRATRVGTSTSNPKVGTEISATIYYRTTALTDATATYQWSRVDANGTATDISGATSASYTPVLDDVGQRIRVTAVGNGYYSGTLTATHSEATVADLTALQITASPQVGEAITATVSPSGATATYCWYRITND